MVKKLSLLLGILLGGMLMTTYAAAPDTQNTILLEHSMRSSIYLDRESIAEQTETKTGQYAITFDLISEGYEKETVPEMTRFTVYYDTNHHMAWYTVDSMTKEVVGKLKTVESKNKKAARIPVRRGTNMYYLADACYHYAKGENFFSSK